VKLVSGDVSQAVTSYTNGNAAASYHTHDKVYAPTSHTHRVGVKLNNTTAYTDDNSIINISGVTTAITMNGVAKTVTTGGTIALNGVTTAITMNGVTKQVTTGGTIALSGVTTAITMNGNTYPVSGNGQVNLGQVITRVQTVTGNSVTMSEIHPNIYYKFTGTGLTKLEIKKLGTGAGYTSDRIPHYLFEYDCPNSSTLPTIILPSGISWNDDEGIVNKAATKVQVSILHNAGVVGYYSLN
jgi:hypothetical protein